MIGRGLLMKGLWGGGVGIQRIISRGLAETASVNKVAKKAVQEKVADQPKAKAPATPAVAAASTYRQPKEKPKRKPRVKRPPLPTPPPPPKIIVAATVVERLPVITPDPEPWEVAMVDLRRRKDLAVRKHMIPEWFSKSGVEGDSGPAKEEEALIIAPRVTEADKANDIRSRDRALARRLYLLIKGKDGNWGFPQTSWKEGEKMRETAARTLAEHCGEGLTVIPIGNCPMAYFDSGEGEGKRRTFFYYSQYLKGELELHKENATDYVWLKREELEEYLPKEIN